MTLLPFVFTLTNNLREMFRPGAAQRKNETTLLPATKCSLITFIAAATFFIGGSIYLSGYFGSVLFSPNSPPVAVNDSYSLHGSITVQGPGIVANDYDPEGSSLSLASCSTPAHGTVNCTQYKSFTYEPNFGYVGADSFTYQVCDNLGACSTGTVNLTINNTAPVAVADFFIWQGALVVPGNMALRENDFDPDNDPRSVISYTQPAHGVANYSFSVGSLSYAPNAGFTGLDTFTYVLRDNLGLSSTATVYILVLPGAGPNAQAPYACCPTDPGFLSQFFPQAGGLAGGMGGVAGASGPSWPDPVNLATGRETYAHAPDLEIYNPTGPAVAWQRHYSGQQALTGIAGYGSPGLTRSYLRKLWMRG